MVKRVAVIIIVLFAAAILSSGFQTPTEWIKFSPPDGSFSILMPDKPTSTTQNVSGDDGNASGTLWISRGSAGGYMVCAFVADSDIKDPKKSLLNTQAGLIRGSNTKLVSESEIKLDGYPGLEFTSTNDTATFKFRLYVVGRHTYQIGAVELTAQLDQKRVASFLDSFVLIQKSK